MTTSLPALLLCLSASCLLAAEAPDRARATADAIRVEVLRANDDPDGRPLPLTCSWTCGHFPKDSSAGWRPANQMRLIADGHHLLPWFAHPTGEPPADREAFVWRYYRQPLLRARELRLPLTFIASQWESGLSRPPWLGLPAAENPNVVTAEGKPLAKVCPFGPVAPWRAIGRTHTDNAWFRQFQEWYPDPPRVIFLSNNEHSKLRWHEVETSPRYLARYGPGRGAEFQRQVVCDGWIERYRALQAGLREGLSQPAWRERAVCIAYDAFGPPHLARWGGIDPADGQTAGGWVTYSLYTPGRIDPSPLTWDGGSPSYYTDDWNQRTDHTVWSPQVEFMNLVFMQREAWRVNPAFWCEFSVWDGYHNDPQRQARYPSKRAVYRAAGQVYDPVRYAGYVQFGLWLLRPRAVRDFRGWTEPWDDLVGPDGRVHEGGGPYSLALARAVDRVHADPLLRAWWRRGELVANRAHPHPYQAGVPREYEREDRWFGLDTTLDPPRPWKLNTVLPVFALALTRGQAPTREWLVYAHAPTGARRGVGVTLPGWRPVTLDVPVGGAFYQVDEATGRVARCGDEPPGA